MTWLALRFGLIVVAGAAGATEPSSYAGWQARTIKALSPEQIEDFLAGRGMAMALPAELNGYPGPRHGLDLADELALTPGQLAQTEALFEDMRRQASELGARIVAHEAELDELFASGTASGTRVHETTAALGLLSGQLRAHHLSYHLAMRDLLEPSQIQQYQRLRGYASSTTAGRHGHGHGGHGGH
jgi:Spy/CpxP family protein refolding chaperone